MKTTKNDWADKIIYSFAGILLVTLIFGVGWCKWEGYKQRFPNGGCIGFITEHR